MSIVLEFLSKLCTGIKIAIKQFYDNLNLHYVGCFDFLLNCQDINICNTLKHTAGTSGEFDCEDLEEDLEYTIFNVYNNKCELKYLYQRHPQIISNQYTSNAY